MRGTESHAIYIENILIKKSPAPSATKSVFPGRLYCLRIHNTAMSNVKKSRLSDLPLFLTAFVLTAPLGYPSPVSVPKLSAY